MRGKIIMWTGDKGVAAAAGQQYPFDIGHWRGGVAPRPDLTVDLILTDGALTSLAPVETTEVARERMGQLGGQGKVVAQKVYRDVGRNVAVGYGVFAVCALFLPFIKINMFGFGAGGSLTLLDALGGVGNSGGVGLFWLVVALGSVTVPHFWKHPYAPLAFGVPLLVTFYAAWKLHHAFSAVTSQMGSVFGGAGGDLAKGMNPFSLSFAAYLTFLAAAYLCYCGVQRYRRRPAALPAAEAPLDPPATY